MGSPEIFTPTPLSEKEPKVSRRTLLKGAAVLSIPLFIRTTEASALDGQEVTSAFSSEYSEYMNLPFEEQTEYVQSGIDSLMSSRSKPLLKAGKELGGILETFKPTVHPPLFAKNIEQAFLDQEPFYQIGETHDPSFSLNSIGLLKDWTERENFAQQGFLSMTDALILGITNHNFNSVVGDLTVQIAHLGGFYGNERKGRWVMPLYLGFHSQDESVFIPRREWYETSNRSDERIAPFRHDLNFVTYEEYISKLFTTREKGVTSFTIGVGLPLSEMDYSQFAAENNAPPELFDLTMTRNQAQAARNSYEWLKWKAVYAAANNETKDYSLISYPKTAPDTQVLTRITDVFPEISDPSSEPPIITSEELLSPSSENITIEQIWRLPIGTMKRYTPSETKILKDLK